jgi:hypothetical protein
MTTPSDTRKMSNDQESCVANNFLINILLSSFLRETLVQTKKEGSQFVRRMMLCRLGLLSSPGDQASARQAMATYLEEDDFTGLGV